jgi:hypothetical protein
MEEEQHFDGALEAVDEAIQAAEVGQFMDQDGLGGKGIQVREEANGKQDYRAKQSHAHGCGDADGFQEAYGPPQSRSLDKNLQPLRL